MDVYKDNARALRSLEHTAKAAEALGSSPPKPPEDAPPPPPRLTTQAIFYRNPVVIAQLIFFLFKFGDSMLEPTVRLYIYQGVCLLEYSNFTACDNMQDHPDWETRIQQMSAGYLLGYKILINVPAIVMGLFCGAWSDHVGRKIPVILPCLGTILAVLLYMISMVTDDEVSLPLVLTGAGIRGFFGKSAVITMALHSYVSDVTTKEERTERLGQLLAMNYFGYFAGSLLAGALLGYTTYDVIFCVVVIIMGLAVAAGLIMMKESLPQAAIIDTDAKFSEKIQAVRKSPFHLDHLKEAAGVIIKPREARARAHIIGFFLVIIFHQMCKSGETDITLLFVKRSPLNWSKSLYGYLVAVDYACLGVGVMLILPAFVKYFHMGDMSLVITGAAFKTFRIFLLAFSDLTWMVFVAVIIGGPTGLIVSGCKSMISKSVHEDEMGKAFSLLSCSETVSNLLGSLLFTTLYSNTLNLYAGFVYTLEGICYVILLILLALLAYKMHVDKRDNLLFKNLEQNYGATTESNSDLNPSTYENGEVKRPIELSNHVGSGERDQTLKLDLETQYQAVMRKRNIPEDEVERMSVNSSRFVRQDSSDYDEDPEDGIQKLGKEMDRRW